MSTSDTVSVMDQYADASAVSGANVVQSALAHAALPEQSNATPRAAGVTLVEKPVIGLLILRADASQAMALSDALKAACGIALSARLQSNSNETYCIRWMSPDSWLLSCPLDKAFSIEQALRTAVQGHIAIVNVSGGYCVLELHGPKARNVLKKSTGYDVDPDNFASGKVVNTTFSKAQMTMRAIEAGERDGRYELLVRRSFSDYVWLWLQKAGREYGMRAVGERV